LTAPSTPERSLNMVENPRVSKIQRCCRSTVAPEGAENRDGHHIARFAPADHGPSAADLKFLQRLPQGRIGTSNRKAALES
jgi:hypothetical protein